MSQNRAIARFYHFMIIYCHTTAQHGTKYLGISILPPVTIVIVQIKNGENYSHLFNFVCAKICLMAVSQGIKKPPAKNYHQYENQNAQREEF